MRAELVRRGPVGGVNRNSPADEDPSTSTRVKLVCGIGEEWGLRQVPDGARGHKGYLGVLGLRGVPRGARVTTGT